MIVACGTNALDNIALKRTKVRAPSNQSASHFST
jgi:hypothetical protein